MADSHLTAAELRERLSILRSGFTEALKSKNTRRGYRYDCSAFRRWCGQIGADPLPAAEETIALHMMSMFARNLKCSSVARRVAAIAHMHEEKGLPSPFTKEIREILRGARRAKLDQVRRVVPLSIGDLAEVSRILAADQSPVSTRNRCIFVVGFASALRTASLSFLRMDDVSFSPKGLLLRIRQEKQDQEGKGRLVGLPHGKHPETCPVIAMKEWLACRGSDPGPLFTRFDKGRFGKDVPLRPLWFGRIVQACLKRIGLPWREYGGHSLRSGFITEAGEANVGELLIASQSGHTDMETLRQYFRRRDVFKSNACALLDL